MSGLENTLYSFWREGGVKIHWHIASAVFLPNGETAVRGPIVVQGPRETWCYEAYISLTVAETQRVKASGCGEKWPVTDEFHFHLRMQMWRIKWPPRKALQCSVPLGCLTVVDIEEPPLFSGWFIRDSYQAPAA
jgi:hypothetical protein